MNSTLMKAILSMDAYNRGYDAGIEFHNADQTVNREVGNYTITAHSSDLLDEAGNPNVDDNIGFYALAYAYNGETVISYRGTDDFDEASDYFSSLDVSNWLLGTGNYLVDQGVMALEFYNAVAGDPSDTRTANISLTGHSLGGGLAGLVGANDNRFSEERDAA